MTFNLQIFKGEDGYYVAYCKEIPGVVTQGKTMDEVHKNFVEALMATLEAIAQESASPEEPPVQGRHVKTSRVQLVPA